MSDRTMITDVAPEYNAEILELTAEIVSAHISNNPLDVQDLPSIIEQVHNSLETLARPAKTVEIKQKPAVPISKSVTPSHIICLEDGKKLKILKRHLKTLYNLTPEQYRTKWGLAPDYPMVAPDYAEQRRILAKRIGLGRSRTPQKHSTAA